MHHLTITYLGTRYTLHYAADQLLYLRTPDGTILEPTDLSPRLLALCEQAIALTLQ